MEGRGMKGDSKDRRRKDKHTAKYLSISALCDTLVMSAMYFITFFDASVLPAPLSPVGVA